MEFDDSAFVKLDVLVPRGLRDELDGLDHELNALLNPLIDRQARQREVDFDLEDLDRLLPQGSSGARRGEDSSAVGRLRSREEVDQDDEHAKLKQIVNTSAISWVGWEMALEEASGSTTVHPLTRNLEGTQRTCWGQAAPGEASANKGACEAVVLKSMERRMVKGVKRKISDCKLRHLKGLESFFNLSLRHDTTSQMVGLSEDQCKKRYEESFNALMSEPYLTQADKDRLADVLKRQRTALIHILTSRCRIRWGPRKQDSERVVTRPLAIASTSSKSIAGGVRQLIPDYDLYDLIDDVSSSVGWFTLHMGTDSASGVERHNVELGHFLKPYSNVCLNWRYCGVHDAEHLVEETMLEQNTANRMYQMSKLLRNADYSDSWLTGMAKLVAKADMVDGSSAEAVLEARRESDEFIDRVCKTSIYREHTVKARSHPSLGERSKAADIPEELLEKVANVKKFWQCRSKRFRRRRHLCNYASSDTCPCTNQADACYHMCASLMALALPLMPTGTIDITNWGSVQPMLSMIFFLTMFTYIGPQGWCARWPQRLVDAMLFANDVPPGQEPSYQLEQTRRLSGVSKTFGDIAVVITLTLMHLALMPIDRLMRYCQYADSEERHADLAKDNAEHSPYLFEFFRTDALSPADVALK